jgi:hypothetical protein
MLRRAAASAFALFAFSARATTVTFDPSALVAQIHTRGRYDNAGLGTWNRQPFVAEGRP